MMARDVGGKQAQNRRFASEREVLTVNQEVYKIPLEVSLGALRAKSMSAVGAGRGAGAPGNSFTDRDSRHSGKIKVAARGR